MNKYIKQKIELAETLYSKIGTYGDATLVACTALSAIAARIWPGDDKIDRKRFVQLIVNHADDNLKNKWISIPLLHQYLSRDNTSPFTSQDYSRLLEGSLIVTENDIDMREEDLLNLFPQLDKKTIRKYSYPNLIYEELRCAYVHEYSIGEKAGSIPMTSRNVDVSYVNRLDITNNTSYKMIHFHFKYLCELISKINQRLNPLEKYFNFARPSKWWIEA